MGMEQKFQGKAGFCSSAEETSSLSFFPEIKLPIPRAPCPCFFSFLLTQPREALGAPIPLPFPEQILSSCWGIFLAQSPENFPRIFYFWGFFWRGDAPSSLQPILISRVGMNPKTCRRGIKLSNSISLSSQIRGEGTSIPCRKRQENLSPPRFFLSQSTRMQLGIPWGISELGAGICCQE